MKCIKTKDLNTVIGNILPINIKIQTCQSKNVKYSINLVKNNTQRWKGAHSP